MPWCWRRTMSHSSPLPVPSGLRVLARIIARSLRGGDRKTRRSESGGNSPAVGSTHVLAGDEFVIERGNIDVMA